LPGAVLLCVLCASAPNVRAADWSFTPSVTLSESYNSNYQFTTTPLPGTTKSDFITSITPVFSITGTTENTIFTFDTVTPAQAYIKNPKYDTIDTDTTTSLTEIWSPRFSTTESLVFAHNQTLEQQLQASGIVARRTDQYQFTYGLNCTYGMSETVNLIVSGTYARSIYPSGQLPDSDVYQATIMPVWSFSPRSDIGLSSSLAYSDYSGGSGLTSSGAETGSGGTAGSGTTIKSATEMLIFDRNFSETMSLKLGAGYYLSSLRFIALTPELIQPFPPFPFYKLVFVPKPAKATEGGFVFSADLKKDWSERFSTTLSAGRQQFNDVNANSFDSTFLSETASYRLSEVTTVNFTAKYNMNDQLSGSGQKIDYYIINPDIQRNLTENLTVKLAGSYEHEFTSSSGIGTTASNLGRYCTWVELIYRWPRFLATH